MFEAGKKDSFRRVLLIISIAVVSFWIGTESTGMWAEKMKSNTASTTVTVTNLYSPAKKTSVDFDEFWQVWDRVKNNHVNTDIKDSDLFYGAIRGMVAGVGDPHTMYFPPKETEEFKKDLAGEFEGIGAEVGI